MRPLLCLILGVICGAGAAAPAVLPAPLEFDFAAEQPANDLFLHGHVNHIADRGIRDGALHFDTTGSDPYFAVVPIDRKLSELDRLAIEMAATSRQPSFQVFFNFGHQGAWRGTQLIADGQFHTYTFELDKIDQLAKAGHLWSFRFDPAQPGAADEHFALRAIRFYAAHAQLALPLAAVVPQHGHGRLHIDGFRQVETGGNAAAKTIIDLSYDAEQLYVAFETAIDNVTVKAQAEHHDGPVYDDDSLEFFFMTAPDRYDQIAVNAHDVLYDSETVWQNGAAVSRNAAWESQAVVKSTIAPSKWSGTLTIPLAALGGPRGVWKVNILRNSVYDGKGRSAWCFFRGRNNHQPDTWRQLEFGVTPSPSVTLLTPGGLAVGQNTARFANPDGAPLQARVVVRNLASGATLEFTGSGNAAEVSVSYMIPAAGDYELLFGAGDGQRNWFADTLNCHSQDYSLELQAQIQRLEALPPTLPQYRAALAELLADGRQRQHEFQSGAPQMLATETFLKRSRQFLARQQAERFRKSAEEYLHVSALPFGLAAADSMDKVFDRLGDSAPAFPGRPLSELRVEGASREIEGCQLVLLGLDQSVEGLQLTCNALMDKGGRRFPGTLSFARVGYVSTAGLRTNYPTPYAGNWPEILIPLQPFSLAPDQVQPIWLKTFIPPHTPPGEYSGKLRLAAPALPRPIEIPFSVTVWDFELPATPCLQTAVSLDHAQILTYYEALLGKPLTENQRNQLLDQLARFMLENKMNPCNIYDWTAYSGQPIPFPRPQCYQEFAALGMNAVPIANLTPGGFHDPASQVREWYRQKGQKLPEAIQTNYRLARQAGVEKMLYLHAFDEVMAHQDARGKCALIRELVAQWKQQTPELQVECITYPEPELGDSVTIFCPSFSMFARQAEAYRQKQRQGARLWFYTCLGSPAPGHEPSFVLEAPASDLRMIGWLCARYQADGFLYYTVANWDENTPKADQTVWPNAPWHPMHSPGYNGEACLLYPGTLDHPLTSSQRFENLRDGFEDYEYLQILRQRCRDHARPAPEMEPGLVQSVTQFTHDSQCIRAARRAIARQIQSLDAGPAPRP